MLPLCHGRGREFESRRPRHSFQKVHADFVKSIERTKRQIPIDTLVLVDTLVQ